MIYYVDDVFLTTKQPRLLILKIAKFILTLTHVRNFPLIPVNRQKP